MVKMSSFEITKVKHVLETSSLAVDIIMLRVFYQHSFYLLLLFPKSIKSGSSYLSCTAMSNSNADKLR